MFTSSGNSFFDNFDDILRAKTFCGVLYYPMLGPSGVSIGQMRRIVRASPPYEAGAF